MDMRFSKLKEMMSLQILKNDVVANNLANVSTKGYKEDVIFCELLNQKGEQLSKIHKGFNFSQGSIEQTDNPLDLAISGRGFFVVENDGGEAYTRNGHFSVDKDGFLRTSNGNPILGQGGWINISRDGEKVGEFVVTSDGDIYVDGEFIDTLRVVDFDSYEGLGKIGSGLFVSNDDMIARDLDESSVLIMQGKLEESNVNPVSEMIELINIQRKFESGQKAISSIDEALRKTVNNVGSFK